MVRTLKTFVIDSRQLTHTSGTNAYTLNLNSQLDFPLSNDLFLQVHNYYITNSWQYVRSTNNKITVTEWNNSDLVPLTGTISLTQGNYNSTTFCAMVKSVLETWSAASGYTRTYTVSISTSTGLLTIVNASSKKTRLDFSSSTSAYLLMGFNQTTYDLQSSNSYTQVSPNIVDLLGGINQVLIKCDLVGDGVITSYNSGNSTVLISIGVDSNFLDLQSGTFNSGYIQVPLTPARKDIYSIRFEVTSEDNEEMEPQYWGLTFSVIQI